MTPEQEHDRKEKRDGIMKKWIASKADLVIKTRLSQPTDPDLRPAKVMNQMQKWELHFERSLGIPA